MGDQRSVMRTKADVIRLLLLVGLAVLFFGLAYGGTALTRGAGRVSALWLPNALLFAILWQGIEARRVKVIACFIANVAANLLSGDTVPLALGLAGCNILEVLAIAVGLRRWTAERGGLTEFKSLLRFMLLAGLAVPPVIATAAMGFLHVGGDAVSLPIWFTFAKAHALGQILVVPVLLILAQAWRARAAPSGALTTEAIAILGTVVLACALVFSQNRLPLLFVVMPFVLFAAFRLGAVGAACAIIVVASASGVATMFGTGPIALVDGIAQKLTVLQLFLATSFVSALPVAAALAQRERLAGALRTSERMLASVTDNIRDVVFRADRQGRWSFLNPAWEELTGYPVARSIGRPVTELILPEEAAGVRAQFHELIAGNAGELHTQFRFRRANGEMRWIETTIRRQEDDGGRVVGTIGSIRDITERHEQASALAERERELRLITTHSADMIVRTGMDRVRRYVSPASRALLGYEPEEIIDREPFYGIHPDDVPKVAALCDRVARLGQPAHSIHRQRHRDGRYVWLETIYSIVRDERTGEPVEFIANVRDFEARKRMEEQLSEARDRAEDAARLKASFLANMSHEIRTPMNGVIGFTELLLAGDLDAEQRRHAGLIAESGRTMMALLNDILDLSKIDADQIEIAHEPFDLPHAIGASVRIVGGGAAAKGLGIDLAIDGGLPRCAVGDAHRLRQILLNLLSNAIKFTESGTVRVAASAHEGRLEIMVEDTGAGIAPERQAAIFEQFVQADASIARRYGGTGLGLAISQRLARLMGGDLTLDRSDASGTRMRLTVPLRPARAEDLPGPSASKARPYVPAERARILVAEDAEINQLLIDALLKRDGHIATIVANGAEAVAAFAAASDAGDPYDLILMDMQMPEVDGLEATRRVRALGGAGATIPIVALTANAFASDAEACRRAGMDAHLAKPIDAEALMATISRLTGAKCEPGPEPATPIAEDPAIAALRGRYDALKTTLATQLEELEDALRSWGEDAEPPLRAEIAGICHKLAGSAGMFGDEELGALARSVEHDAHGGAARAVLVDRTRALAAALAA